MKLRETRRGAQKKKTKIKAKQSKAKRNERKFRHFLQPRAEIKKQNSLGKRKSERKVEFY